jgi:hypothetical protein
MSSISSAATIQLTSYKSSAIALGVFQHATLLHLQLQHPVQHS